MKKILAYSEIFNKNKIIPVVAINDLEKAVLVTQALVNGGINIVEVTLRTPNALQIIATLRKKLPNVIIGAGTILNSEQYNLALDYGAQFIVSPGLTHDLINVSSTHETPFLPGAVTPTEILTAYNNGFSYLKYFPAESYNGITSLTSIANIFPKIKFCPTGGLNLTNIKDYLSLPNVFAVGCSFLVTDTLINNNEFNIITELTKNALVLANSL
jgi:2-dehydro-3-deoxyphosphogluconate aldolase/(4S)-4-hydroxy-2-oxoglutarate aldolase